MKYHTIGVTTYFGKFWFTLARRLFGKKYLIVPKEWSTYKYTLGQHFRGEVDGKKFVYCPISLIVSWHPEDYNHKWCEACKELF